MKICLISDFAQTGGAAIAADRIAWALHQVGCNIHRISSNAAAESMFQEYSLQESRKIQLLMTLSGSKLLRYIKLLRKRNLLNQAKNLMQFIKPDIIHAHNLHSAGWPISLIKTCLDYAPVAWTLHDCWSFLGSFYPTYTYPSIKLRRELITFGIPLRQNPPKYKICGITPSAWMKNNAYEYRWKDYPVK